MASGNDPGRPGPDPDNDENTRQETLYEQLDRNWAELLQELRVVQTGVQFLTGFLLTLPFQQRFAELQDPEKVLYLATAMASVVSTAFLQSPVSVHRALFRRHQRELAVLVSHRVAIVGMVFLGLAVVGVSALIVGVVVGTGAAVLASGLVAALLLALWLVLPVSLRGERRRPATGRRRPLPPG